MIQSGMLRATRQPLMFAFCSGRRQRISPRTVRRHPRQSAARADRLLPSGRLPGAPIYGERTFAVAELATFYGRDSSVGHSGIARFRGWAAEFSQIRELLLTGKAAARWGSGSHSHSACN